MLSKLSSLSISSISKLDEEANKSYDRNMICMKQRSLQGVIFNMLFFGTAPPPPPLCFKAALVLVFLTVTCPYCPY